MIITCPQCSRKMRVDESRLPVGQRAKVRCPHCNEISSLEGAGATGTGGPPVTGPSTEVPPASVSAPRTDTVETQKSELAGGAEHQDLCFPRDAFQNFRFPAETDPPTNPKKPRSSMMRLVMWIAISLAIIGLFALLVNLLLPGPSGERPFSGTGKTEQTLPKAPPGPESARPGMGR